MKNPEFPARILNFDEEVTTLAFSRKRPYLLAVGVANGSVFVYDIRSERDSALLECSTGSPFKHSQAVWQIKWIDKGMEKGGEVLVTISSDGKVKEFNFKQGLQSTNLMTLKRIPRSQEENFRWKPLNSKGEGIVSGEESGMCFDFALDNPHIYFCGTWCSSAKRENFNYFSFSCFYYTTQITRISFVLLTHTLQENHSNAHSIVTNT